jgi:putative transposase
MAYDAEKHHRRSIRLRGYDYAQPSAYFITIVCQGRLSPFGQVTGGVMVLNDAGHMIVQWWDELSRKYPGARTDQFVVMPNHFHGIVVLSGAKTGVPVGANLRVCPNDAGAHAGAPLPEIVQWFKTMTTNAYIRGVKQSGWHPFPGKLWQRNYYEHIIRNQDEWHHISQYIANNPAQWDLDCENPAYIARAPHSGPPIEHAPWQH